MGSVAVESHKQNGNTAHGGPTLIKSYAPATGDLLGELPVHTTDEIQTIVSRAR